MTSYEPIGHKPYCAGRPGSLGKCDCGYDDLRMREIIANERELHTARGKGGWSAVELPDERVILQRLLEAVTVEPRGHGRETLHVAQGDLRTICDDAAKLLLNPEQTTVSWRNVELPDANWRQELPEAIERITTSIDAMEREAHTIRGTDGRLLGGCIDGKEHGEVMVFADDPQNFDPSVLGETPDDTVYGYCRDCHRGFRWSVSLQRWRLWPGDVATLPMLNDEELDVLHIAIRVMADELRGNARVADALTVKPVAHRLNVLESLDTAVMETRYGLDQWSPPS